MRPKISIHALREEGDIYGELLRIAQQAISIHALRKEGDRTGCQGCQAPTAFLSTPSARRATSSAWSAGRPARISIHALRKEGDAVFRLTDLSISYFYPRPPQGGRLGCIQRDMNVGNFYPRPPQGGRPPLPTGQGVYCCIFLSTPSARRATQIDTQQTGHLFHFYPRPPQGGRLYKLSHVLSRRQFLSTPSARRATP